jgi:hypothetical protein
MSLSTSSPKSRFGSDNDVSGGDLGGYLDRGGQGDSSGTLGLI